MRVATSRHFLDVLASASPVLRADKAEDEADEVISVPVRGGARLYVTDTITAGPHRGHWAVELVGSNGEHLGVIYAASGMHETVGAALELVWRADLLPKRGRLEYLRRQIEAEQISYAEIAELQGMADLIDPDDVVLREWAGLPEN